MPVITLLTDFGTHDAYVGIMKGVILQVHPGATIIDITHRIDPQDLVQAAYMVADTYKYFPANSIHIIVVDPGVGSDRRIVALRKQGQFFLAPDNGVLTPVLDKEGEEQIHLVTNTRYFLKPVSQTFHGRDIFAPVGAQLAKGLAIHELGKPIDGADLVRLDFLKPHITENGMVTGAVVSIDRFGNLISNINWRFIEHHFPAAAGHSLRFYIGDQLIAGLSASYSSVEPGRPLAITGSRGYFEIAVSSGSARRHFGTRQGDPVKVAVASPRNNRRSRTPA
jgi:S-adenosylmethionine hydrolase